MHVSPTGQPVLWLTFDAQAQSALSHIIEKFAGRHTGVSFKPHVTLLVNLASHDDAMHTAAAVADQAQPLSVQIEAIDTEPQYFRFLTLRLKPSAELNAVRASACRIAGVANTSFTPHISLLYHQPDPLLQASCRRELSADATFRQLANSRLLINRIAQVAIDATVADWRECATFELT